MHLRADARVLLRARLKVRLKTLLHGVRRPLTDALTASHLCYVFKADWIFQRVARSERRRRAAQDRRVGFFRSRDCLEEPLK